MSFRDIFPLSDPIRQNQLAEALRQLKEKAKRPLAVPIPNWLKQPKAQPNKPLRLWGLAGKAVPKEK